MTWLLQQLIPTAWKGVISAAIEAIAWPAAAVAIAAMFRAEVRLVLERLVRLKYHDFEARFRRELSESENLAEQTRTQAAQPRRLLDLPSEARRVFHELDGPASLSNPARRSPRSVIDDAWSELIAAVTRRADVDSGDPVRTLVERGGLDGTSLLLFERLRHLRSQVESQPAWQPSDDEARRFAELARPLAFTIAQGSVSPTNDDERNERRSPTRGGDH